MWKCVLIYINTSLMCRSWFEKALWEIHRKGHSVKSQREIQTKSSKNTSGQQTFLTLNLERIGLENHSDSLYSSRYHLTKAVCNHSLINDTSTIREACVNPVSTLARWGLKCITNKTLSLENKPPYESLCWDFAVILRIQNKSVAAKKKKNPSPYTALTEDIAWCVTVYIMQMHSTGITCSECFPCSLRSLRLILTSWREMTGDRYGGG